jgi:hypothetical protein
MLRSLTISEAAKAALVTRRHMERLISRGEPFCSGGAASFWKRITTLGF